MTLLNCIRIYLKIDTRPSAQLGVKKDTIKYKYIGTYVMSQVIKVNDP